MPQRDRQVSPTRYTGQALFFSQTNPGGQPSSFAPKSRQDNPENLYIESSEYKQRQNGSTQRGSRQTASFGVRGSRDNYRDRPMMQVMLGQGSTKSITSTEEFLNNLSDNEKQYLESLKTSGDAKLSQYQRLIEKAYGAQSTPSRKLLEQTKSQLDSSEVKLLMLMM